MKYILSLLLIPNLVSSQVPLKNFTVTGTLSSFAEIEKIYFFYFNTQDWLNAGDGGKVDSVLPVKGKFQFSGSIPEPWIAELKIKYIKKEGETKPKTEIFSFFLVPGQTAITAKDSLATAKTTGNKAIRDHQGFAIQEKKYKPEMDSLVNQYVKYIELKDEENKARLLKELQAFSLKKSEAIYLAYFKTNLRSPLALFALRLGIPPKMENPEHYETLWNMLPANAQQWPTAGKLKSLIEASKKLAIGKTAMDFIQADTANNPVSLSSFRGKYLLVDFWASWCGPCRVENPNIVKAYNRYKDKNFTILGVSLDGPRQKEQWIKAIHDDRLTWSHVSDLKYFDNEVAKLYGVNSIPFNLLLDPSGKILAKDLRGIDLEKKLEEILGN